ncbi:unnamed protein product [Pseudo-nitzschia multistriata]|uniref:Uncharacterized protein n=1 Tax=Pseudo-nitzschia multistriata TaxID=183589 RepID=A0A448YXS4_9STRA|nr:unnamed protein product [Pseudo-nitzschia multistriata]VEU35230.1 unnamed protein product [Pseudo-nitzschia multistriata]
MASNNTNETPFELHMSALEAKVEEIDAIGCLIIKGLPSDPEEDFTEELTEEEMATVTMEELNTMRRVLITKSREQQLEEFHEFVLGGQADKHLLFYNRMFGERVRYRFYHFKDCMYKNKRLKKKFDMLFAYTWHLICHDSWMHLNYGNIEGMVSDLAKM